MRTLILLLCLLPAVTTNLEADERPNILWFVVDDMSANFSCYYEAASNFTCYGETLIQTPSVDALAAEGVQFSRAYATAPVCSTFRSALITGMYQTTIGAHHHRSGRGRHRIQLPDGVRPLPEYFQDAGYWTCNGSGLRGIDRRHQPTEKARRGKTDYNFDWRPAMYDSHDWAGRAAGQPFFMQVQLHGGKLRGDSLEANEALTRRAEKELGSATDPNSVRLPPYYPRDPVLLKDWAAYLDSVRFTDRHVGLVIDRLRREELLDNTLIIFFTDHGISHARGKQFLYDEGTHIPLILHGPGVPSGITRDDLVEHIDIAAVSLAAAGIPIPASMQGRDLLAPEYTPRKAVFAARDRCGETTDRIRSVRTDRYLYIRNYHPQRPHLQPSQYKDNKAIVRRLRELNEAGDLDELSRQVLFSPERPPEELYAYREDIWQVRNLAEDPEHAEALDQLRRQLDEWMVETRDPGSEPPHVYDLEIADELSGTNPRSERFRTFKKNAELMRRWASEGK